MREVFVAQDYTRVGFFRSVLEAAGIASFIRNEYSHNSLTELPSGLFFPALCVIHDEDYPRAKELLDEILHAPTPPPATDWQCPECGEEVPATFDSCWQCGAVCPGLEG